MSEPIIIVDYDPHWSILFEQLRTPVANHSRRLGISHRTRRQHICSWTCSQANHRYGCGSSDSSPHPKGDRATRYPWVCV
ncbi:hypothetical protein [Nostoc sp.]|uniref:hypothetical protein n=1 Tax=Nostoc sp. TaxID=1180 RepID=UPI002FFC3A5D